MARCLRFVLLVGALVGGVTATTVLGSSAANASSVKAVIDLSEQRMRVFVNGKQKYKWAVSTGTKKWPTRTGSFTPFGRERLHKSKKWNMTLPHVVKFDQTDAGINAIHGTHLTGRLGRRASHGCVRLAPRNAAIFYKLVGQYGLWSTNVVVKR